MGSRQLDAGNAGLGQPISESEGRLASPGPERSDDERSEESHSGGPGEAKRGGEASRVPASVDASPRIDPEVRDRPTRRRFSAKVKLRILDQADRCAPGELGALLRREGLYTSHLSAWRKQRKSGQLAALAPKKRGRKAARRDPIAEENTKLKREVARLQQRLHQAETIIDVQKKVSELLGIRLNSPENAEEGS